MSDFFNSQVSKDFNLKRLSQKVNPVLSWDKNEELIILLERPKPVLRELKNVVKYFIGDNARLLILSILPFKPLDKDINKNVTDFYELNSIDLKKYIKPYSKILCEGRALNKLTFGDLSVFGFYDYIFNDTKFYSPQLKSYIFPIDSVDDWLMLDNWKRYFAKYQIKKAYSFSVKRERERIVECNVVKDVDKFFLDYKHKNKVAIDTETDGLNFMRSRVGYISLAFDKIKGHFLNWNNVDSIQFGLFIKNKYQIYQHGKFDIKMLLSEGVPRDCLHIDYDTWNAGHILNEMRSNSLSSMSWVYTKLGGYNKPMRDYQRKYKNANNYLEYPVDMVSLYSIYDAISTFEIYERTLEHMKVIDKSHPLKNGWSLERYYFEIVVPSLNMYLDMEYNGAYISTEKLEAAGEILNKKIEKLENEIYKDLRVSREDLNLESPQSVAKFLENHGLPPLAVGKSGQYLTGNDYLQKWKKLGFKEADYILKYRALSTLKKTFVGNKIENSGYWQYLEKHDDGSWRVHPDFMVMLKKSHRNGCKEPNLQQIPVQDKEQSLLIRNFFIPPSEDYYFLSGDFKGLQLRLVAMLLEEGCLMRRVFQDMSGDMHSMTGANIVLNNRVTFEDFVKKKEEFSNQRHKGKQLNFASIFGAGPQTVKVLAIEPYWSDDDCKKYIRENDLEVLVYNERSDIYYTVAAHIRKKYFEEYAGLARYNEKAKEIAQHGYVRSVYGAIRRLPQLIYQGKDSDPSRIANLNNIALNSPIQNMEVTVVHRVMIEINNFMKKNNLKSRFFAQIHDAIEIYVHKDEVEIVWNEIKKWATKYYPEYNNISLAIEGKLSDYFNKNQLWDLGDELN